MQIQMNHMMAQRIWIMEAGAETRSIHLYDMTIENGGRNNSVWAMDGKKTCRRSQPLTYLWRHFLGGDASDTFLGLLIDSSWLGSITSDLQQQKDWSQPHSHHWDHVGGLEVWRKCKVARKAQENTRPVLALCIISATINQVLSLSSCMIRVNVPE